MSLRAIAAVLIVLALLSEAAYALAALLGAR